MDYAGEVAVVGMAWLGDDASMVDFVERHGLTFPSARDGSGDLFARFGVPAQPAWVFVDAAGTAEVRLGAMEREELDTVFAALTEAG